LRVVHAYDLNIAWIDINSPELPQWEKQAHEKADEILARIVDDVLPLEQRDSVELRTVVGPPAEVLHGQSLDAALLVVGSRGRGGFTSLLLGSVSQQLAQHAPCPIVIIPPPAGDRTAPNAN
jgi:nucleotide-binding universal stress UspA family protein